MLRISDVSAGMDLSGYISGIFIVITGLPDACYGGCLPYPVPAKELLFGFYFNNIHD